MTGGLLPGDPAPGFRLTAAGSGRRVSLEDCAGKMLVLIFHSHSTTEAAHQVNAAVREHYPSPEEILVASVVDLGGVPSLLRPGVSAFLSLAYRRAAAGLPSGADPADYILILPDWDGLLSGEYGARNTNHTALIVVVNEDGIVKGRHRGENLAEATLEMLE